MNLFDLHHAIEACRKELDDNETAAMARIKATQSVRAEDRARAYLDGVLQAKHAALALMKSVAAYLDEMGEKGESAVRDSTG